MNKKILFLIILGIIIFGARLVNINEALYDDESNFAYSVTVMDKFGFNQDYYSAQPLNLIYKPIILLFGLETWVFRIVPWLFGIINTIFVYIFARRNWGKQTAFFAIILMLISFYPTLASLQFDVEGNLVLFSILLMFFSYLEYEKISNNRKQLFWQILAGVGLGIAIISKYNSIYIVVTLAIYSFIKRKWKLKQSFNDLFIIYLVGFLLFCCYVLLGIVQSPQNWLDFIWVLGFDRYHSSNFGFMGISIYLLWSTSLLFGFYILSLFKTFKKNLILIVWVTIPILFFTFILPTAGSMDRYFMNTIPALVILGGFYISKINLKKKHLILGSLILVIYTIFLFIINTQPMKYIARFPSLYFNELRNFNINFLFSYTSASGPTFGVNFATIFFTFIIAFTFLIIFIIILKRNFSLAKWFFTIFLFISISFNIFLVSEHIFHPTGVDVSDVKWEMINYVKENNLDQGKIYTNDQGIQWYFEHDYWHKNNKTIGFGDNEISTKPTLTIKNINTWGGTIILLHWPPLPEDSPAWDVTKLCELNRQFHSKNILNGEVYTC
jgi:hypothetical protein